MEFENNGYFWQKLDTLYLSSNLVIDKPKGTVHKRFGSLIYPVNYGYFRDSVVVAHNAMFDIAVLRSINELYHIKMPDFTYVDTVSISRVIHPQLINHKLNTVCEYLGYELDHHHAGSDALGCIAIILDAMEIYDTYEINELLDVMCMKQQHYINK